MMSNIFKTTISSLVKNRSVLKNTTNIYNGCSFKNNNIKSSSTLLSNQDHQKYSFKNIRFYSSTTTGGNSSNNITPDKKNDENNIILDKSKEEEHIKNEQQQQEEDLNNNKHKDYEKSESFHNAEGNFKDYKTETEEKKAKSQERKDFIYSLAALSATWLVIKTYIYEITWCQGSSMQPTLDTNNFILINKYTNDFKVGDLVTAISPTGGYFVCKRIRFIQGDKIIVNPPYDDPFVITIPQGYCWLEGDNPETSRDSKQYGPIPMRMLTGKVVCRVYPFSLLNDPIPKSSTVKIN